MPVNVKLNRSAASPNWNWQLPLLLVQVLLILLAVHSRGAIAADQPAQRGILPKQETGALRFLSEYPDYDGRGVVVAVFDTGVDPAAPGLGVTTDGKPKIIDMIDGSGSGDVDTSTTIAVSDQPLIGLTGRRLHPNPQWKNSGGKYHLGIKRGYDLFPPPLVARLKRERRKDWLSRQHVAESELRLKIAAWDKVHPKPTADEKRAREDLRMRLEQLQAVAKNYVDPGPVFDCVVFHDQTRWRAVIDTDEDGNLQDEKLLTHYRDERQYASFGDESLLNFSVNIYDDGKRLSIVTNCGAHGTHVAGIIAGYFPNQPELNGLAPGAQIISVKIAHSHMDGMETGAGLVRGLAAALRNRCDLINMSYGEITTRPNQGRLIKLFTEAVDKHRVVFVAAAGNSGPALSTVIAPGGTCSAVLGVGAFLSPQMMAAEYTLRERLPAMAYTWTSRGPTTDGDLGVDIFAPGGAIAPVPNWTLNKHMRMHGTSMATPNVSGNLALLLSGLKTLGRDYSPASLRRALQNTAAPVDGAEEFAQGPGLLQVDQAFSYLLAHSSDNGELAQFEVEVDGEHGRRGIYLREPHQSDRLQQARIRIRPKFPESTDNSAKVAFEMPVSLECSHPWIRSGERLLLTNGGQSFSVEVDPTVLSTGVHLAQFLGYDSANRERGLLFRVPVTVIRPCRAMPAQSDVNEADAIGRSDKDSVSLESPDRIAEAAAIRERLRFEPGKIFRRFLAVPDGATWVDIRLRMTSKQGPRTYVLHTTESVAEERTRQGGRRKYVTLKPAVDMVESVPVTAGHTLEVCLAQYWSSLGTSELEFEFRFQGLVPDQSEISLGPDGSGARVRVSSKFSAQRLDSRAELTTHRQYLSPAHSKIVLLPGSRDRLLDGRRIYQLVLRYDFEQPQDAAVTMRFPDIDGLLYDSKFGTQLWMLFDSNKRRVATDDCWPDPIRIGKGKYTLQLQLRHSEIENLQSRTNLLLAIDRPLGRPIRLTILANRPDLADNGGPIGLRVLDANQSTLIYVAAPDAKQIPADASAGDLLLGQISYGKSDDLRQGAGSRPGGYPIRFTLPPAARSKAPSADARMLTSSKRLAESVRDSKVALLKKIPFETHRGLFDRLSEEILQQAPGHLPVLVTRLERLDDVKYRKQRLLEIVSAADAVLSRIKRKKLARQYGTQLNPEDEQAVQQRKRMDLQRAVLVDTLYRKGRALGYMELPDVLEVHPIADPQEHDRLFEANFNELRKWVDTTDEKYVLLHVRRERRKGRFGKALQLLNKSIDASAPTYWYFKKRQDIYEQLGWNHCWEYEKRWLLIRFPKHYEPF